MEQKNRSVFSQLYAFMKPRIGWYLIGLIGLSMTHAIVPVILAFGMKFVIDFSVNGQSNLLRTSVYILGSGMILLVTMYVFFSYTFRTSIRRTMTDVKKRIFRQIQRMPVDHFDKTHSGDAVSTLNHDQFLMEMVYGGHLRNVITSVMTGMYSAIFMTILDWRISIFLIIFALLATAVNSKFARIGKKIAKEQSENNAVLAKVMLEVFHGLSVFKFYSNFIYPKFEKTNSVLVNLGMKATQEGAKQQQFNTLIHWLNFTTLLFISAYMVVNNLTSLGNVVAIMQLYAGVSIMFNTLGRLIVQLQNSIVGTERVLKMLSLQTEGEEQVSRSERQLEELTECIINFSSVTFSYGDKKILDNVNASISKNQSIALVGTSGSGKSTLAKLMMRFYDTDSGDILLFGKSISQYNHKDLRDLIAYVPQDTYLFNTSIRENIRMGRLNASDQEIIEAAKLSQIHDYITTLPDQYDTKVGEKGIRLSGGQRQRIGIARAILKPSPIFVLDEATSALDSENESKIQDIIQSLSQSRTVIIIAHRLSTIVQSDKIIVMERGQVVEEGTHEELISQMGIYRQLYLVS